MLKGTGDEVGSCARAEGSLCQNLIPPPGSKVDGLRGQVLAGPHTGYVCDFRRVIGHYDRDRKEGDHHGWAANSSTLPVPFPVQYHSLP